MPLRALTGYFVGQGSTPAFSILASIIALRKELSVRAEPYWTKAIVARFTRLFIIFGISTLAGSFLTLVENTIIRQRLPDLDSAAYYMVTRFSDISTFLATALTFTLFPFAAELSAKGGGTNRLVVKSSLVLFAGNFLLAIFFLCFGRQILTFLPNGQSYSIYAWAIPVIIAISTVNSIVSFYCVAEMSANRFGFMYFTVPICLVSGLGLMLVTGQGYYLSYLPQSLAAFLKAHNILTLKSVIVWMLVVAVVRLVCCVCYANLTSRRAAFCSELEK
jgi:O-antigen/teichoic acid export membrane protein